MNEEISLFTWLVEGWLKAGIVLAIGLAVTGLLRRYSPEFKLRIWTPILVIVLVLPALLILPRWGVIPDFSGEARISDNESVPRETVSFLTVESDFELIGAESPISPVVKKSPDWRWLGAGVWLLGVGILIARLIFGCCQISLLRKSSGADSVPLPFLERVDNLRRELGLGRQVQIAMGEKIRAPFAWGWRHPLIALPSDAVNWTGADLDAVLRHELTHLVRRDSIGVVMAGIITAVHWPNPLAWMAAKKMAEFREQICDREVLRGGCDPEQYARLLFHHARLKAGPFLVHATAVARPGTLEKRIAMILKPKPQKSPSLGEKPTVRNLLTAAMAAAALLVVIAGVAAPDSLTSKNHNRLQIIVLNDPAVPESDRFEFVLNGAKTESAGLKKALRSAARESSVLVLAPSAPLPLDRMKQVVETAEAAGILSIDIEKPSAQIASGNGTIGAGNGTIGVEELNLPADYDPGMARMEAKLKRITVPMLEFAETPLASVLEFLQARSVELDVDEPEISKRGVNVIIDSAGVDDFSGREINLRLTEVPIGEAFQYVGRLARAEVLVEPHALIIRPEDAKGNMAFGGFFNEGTGSGAGFDMAEPPESVPVSPLARKLNSIVLSDVSFLETRMGDVLEFLRQRSIENDIDEPDPALKGVNFVLKRPDSWSKNVVTLEARNLSLAQVLKLAALQSGARIRVDKNAVLIEPNTGKSAQAELLLGADPELEKRIDAKLNSIIVPDIEFEETSIRDAIEYLSVMSREMDIDESDPGMKGINFVAGTSVSLEIPITLQLRNVTLADAVRYSTELAGMKYEIQGNAVLIVPSEDYRAPRQADGGFGFDAPFAN